MTTLLIGTLTLALQAESCGSSMASYITLFLSLMSLAKSGRKRVCAMSLFMGLRCPEANHLD